MGLEFKDKAIVLSGVAGTRLKTKVLGNYYYFWHSVQSGGARAYYRYRTSLVDLNAGTGLLYIEDEDEIIRGSAGHALDLKLNTPDIGTNNLTVFLVEEHPQCRQFLVENLHEKWDLNLQSFNRGYRFYSGGSVWLFESVEDFLSFTGSGEIIDRGLFLFDPLLAPDYELIQRVASRRIRVPFQRGTEFLVFFFTSDWIKGRKNFAPLPRTRKESTWGEAEQKTANQADSVFGDCTWLEVTTRNLNDDELQQSLLYAYVHKLLKWFRFVLPVPFQPKTNQMYHLLCCSNYEVGINVIKSDWSHLVSMHRGFLTKTGIIDRADTIYPNFRNKYPDVVAARPPRTQKPLEWRVLWAIAKKYVDGTGDRLDSVLQEIVDSPLGLDSILSWLSGENLIFPVEGIPWSWDGIEPVVRYHANYDELHGALGLKQPIPMHPLTPDALAFNRGVQSEEFLSEDNNGSHIIIRMRCPETSCNDVLSTNGAIRIPPSGQEFLSCQNSDCNRDYELTWMIQPSGKHMIRIQGTREDKPFWYRVISNER